jgi:histidinol phosphatase-like enzyme (inositol monophosphatase family)
MDPSVHSDVSARLELALAAARAAGAKTLEWFRSPRLAVDRKGDGSPVTAADRAAETLLREQIAAAFPDDAILGEEFGVKEGRSGFQWVLDPIDGTKSFITGVPLYTTLVAVMQGESPALGVIYSPATDELVYAIAGEPTWYVAGGAAPTEARVSQVERLADATFLTSEVASFGPAGGARNPAAVRPNRRHAYEQLESACRLTRTWGDAYGYMLVATGRADVMVDPEMNLWDAAALQPIIEGAGGHYSDWAGRPTVHTGNSVATNKHLAGLVLSITRGGV